MDVTSETIAAKEYRVLDTSEDGQELNGSSMQRSIVLKISSETADHQLDKLARHRSPFSRSDSREVKVEIEF